MSITIADLSTYRNIFNERNKTEDTSQGVRIDVGRQYRTYLAGHKQKALRDQLGLLIDNTDYGVILKDYTVDSFKELHLQAKAQAAEEKRLSYEAYEKSISDALEHLNDLETKIGKKITTRQEVEGFNNRYSNLTDLEWVERESKKLSVAVSCLPQINQLRRQFPDLVVTRQGVSTKEWSSSYEFVDLIVEDPTIVVSLESRVEKLMGEFERRLKEIGWFTREEQDSSDSDVSLLLESSDDDEGRSLRLFKEKFGCGVDQLLFFWDYSEYKFHVGWGNECHRSNSLDALMIMQRLLGNR